MPGRFQVGSAANAAAALATKEAISEEAFKSKYGAMRPYELKSAARKRGLDDSGTKDEIIKRLVEDGRHAV